MSIASRYHLSIAKLLLLHLFNYAIQYKYKSYNFIYKSYNFILFNRIIKW